jgi:hypothetical protein
MNSRLIILCTGNSCRSQMAEGFLRELAGDLFDVQSAGMNPASEVHPLAIKVMSEIGKKFFEILCENTEYLPQQNYIREQMIKGESFKFEFAYQQDNKKSE